MGRWGNFFAGAALAVLALSPNVARAQSGAACPIGAPVTVTATSYNLSNNDECQALVFTAASPVTVTAPNANTVAPGFQVMLIPLYNGLTVTSSASRISNLTSQGLGPGQSAVLMGDGTNYFWGGGSGFGTIPATVSGTTVGAGTNFSNSPTIMLPNGILQITNPASVIPGGDAFTVCKGGTPLALGPVGLEVPRGAPSWWPILGPMGKVWKVPLC